MEPTRYKGQAGTFLSAAIRSPSILAAADIGLRSAEDTAGFIATARAALSLSR
jgi:hypothetical protein